MASRTWTRYLQQHLEPVRHEKFFRSTSTLFNNSIETCSEHPKPRIHRPCNPLQVACDPWSVNLANDTDRAEAKWKTGCEQGRLIQVERECTCILFSTRSERMNFCANFESDVFPADIPVLAQEWRHGLQPLRPPHRHFAGGGSQRRDCGPHRWNGPPPCPQHPL
jgi:hypothetical protein